MLQVKSLLFLFFQKSRVGRYNIKIKKSDTLHSARRSQIIVKNKLHLRLHPRLGSREIAIKLRGNFTKFGKLSEAQSGKVVVFIVKTDIVADTVFVAIVRVRFATLHDYQMFREKATSKWMQRTRQKCGSQKIYQRLHSKYMVDKHIERYLRYNIKKKHEIQL